MPWGLQDLLDAAVEEEPEVVDAPEAVLLHGTPARPGDRSQTPAGTSSPPMWRLRRGTPASRWRATRSCTTCVDERVRGGQGGVHHVVVVELRRGVLGAVLRVAQQEAPRPLRVALRAERPEAGLHRLDRGAGVARHLQLGDHLDVPRRGVPQDLHVVGPGVEPAPVGPVRLGPGAVGGRQEAARVEGVPAPGAHRGELGEARDLDAPALVVGEVEVEDVELVARHQVERPQHRGLGLEVARDVEHEPAVAEARGVHDRHRGEGQPLGRGRGRRQQAPQGLQAVEDAGGRGCRACGCPRPGRRRARRPRASPGPRRGRSRAARTAPPAFPAALREVRAQVLRGERGLRLQLRRRRHRRHRLEPQLPLPLLERPRSREDRGQGVQGDVAHGLVERVLRLRRHDAGIPPRLGGALEGHRDVVRARARGPGPRRRRRRGPPGRS